MTAKHYANYQHIECQLSDDGIAQLILNRPQYANAFHDQMIAELISAIDQFASNKTVRGLLLCGHGKHFSAGADITWMRSMLNKSQQDNQLDAISFCAQRYRGEHRISNRPFTKQPSFRVLFHLC